MLQAELMFRTKCAFQFVCCSFEVLSTPIWAAEHITFCISWINAAVRLFTWSQTWWCGSQVFSLSECPSCSDSLCQENAICKVTLFNACSSPSESSRISSSLSLTWLREEFSLQQFDPLYKELVCGKQNSITNRSTLKDIFVIFSCFAHWSGNFPCSRGVQRSNLTIED